MIEKEDVKLLRELMADVIREQVPQIIQEQVPQIIQEQVPQIIQEQVPRMIDERISKTEDFLLDEIGRTQTYLERKIDRIAADVEELKAAYRINRLESDTVNLLMRNVRELDRRVSAVEIKMVL